MSAHTPGPWMVLPSVERGQFCILTEAGNRIDIAVTYGFEHQPREANARLISAAPELLEALILMVRTHDEPAETLLQEAKEQQWIAKARAAIAKATGAQP